MELWHIKVLASLAFCCKVLGRLIARRIHTLLSGFAFSRWIISEMKYLDWHALSIQIVSFGSQASAQYSHIGLFFGKPEHKKPDHSLAQLHENFYEQCVRIL